MPLRFTLILHNTKAMARGLGGLVLILVIVWLPTFLVVPMDPETAEREIRLYLKRIAMSEHLDVLKAAGMSTPDELTARRMHADLQGLKRMEFASVEVRTFLFYPPFISGRIYMAKAVIREDNTPNSVRYFSIGTRSKIANYYWVGEKSRLMWLLSF